MRRLFFLAVLTAAGHPAPAAEEPRPSPYEAGEWAIAETPLDGIVRAAQAKAGLQPAGPCSDAVFLRRIHLDLTGTLPEPAETRRFLRDADPRKREALVEALLLRPEFADYWSLKWCDLLRVKAEFPINLWPNAVQCYHRWVRDAVRGNMPYDRFARALLTSSGSNFRVPPVNFYRAVQGGEPAALAEAVALTFMGTRVESLSRERRDGMAAFFSRLSRKGTAEWKEEILFPDPAPAGPLAAVFPDGRPVEIAPGTDPRIVFADWLVAADNPWFARAVVNRAWSWFFGRGVVHETDDLRDDNPPSVPGLLEHLQKELILADWDLRELFRRIVLSRTYQQSPLPRGDPGRAGALFACYPVRRLDAEVLADALAWIGGARDSYTSAIPEPFTFLPPDARTIALADGSITSPFLETFGRPARDTGLESERNNRPTAGQSLYLLNSTDVRRRIEESPRLRALIRESRGSRDVFVRGLYETLLSRYPTAEEMRAVERFGLSGDRDSREVTADLAWALVNTGEFLCRH